MAMVCMAETDCVEWKAGMDADEDLEAISELDGFEYIFECQSASEAANGDGGSGAVIAVLVVAVLLGVGGGVYAKMNNKFCFAGDTASAPADGMMMEEGGIKQSLF